MPQTQAKTWGVNDQVNSTELNRVENNVALLADAAVDAGIAQFDHVGHSIAAGGGATVLPDYGYGEHVAQMLGVHRRRHMGIGGAIACWPTGGNVGDGGWPHVLQEMRRPGSPAMPAAAAPYLPATPLILAHYGLNDLAQLGSQKPAPFQEAMRTILSRCVAAAVFEDESAAWTRSGAWTALGGADYNSGAQLYYSTTVGNYAEFVVPADYPGGRTVAIGLWLNATWAACTYNVTIDGVAQPDIVVTPANVTDQGAASKHIGITRRYAIGAAGTHTIRITLASGPGLAIDYAQIESDPLDGPIVAVPLPHKPSTYSLWNTWAHGPSAGTDPMNDAAVDSWKTSLQTVVNEFPTNVFTVPIDDLGLNSASGGLLSSDGVHPSDLGHAVLAARIGRTILNKNLITDRVRTRHHRAMRPWKQPVVRIQGPKYATGWGDRATAGDPPLGYSKDANGTVRLYGMAAAGGGYTATIFTLPPGFRPEFHQNFAVPRATGSGTYDTVMVRVGPDGIVQQFQPAVSTTAGNWLAINISFEAYQ